MANLEQRWIDGCNFLRRQGLNLIAVFAIARLPESVISVISESGVAVSEDDRLVLLGNGGGDFWQSLQAVGMNGDKPVDDFSRYLAEILLSDYLQVSGTVLYPGPLPIPLQQLGAAAGWHYPSPLGIGIHPAYGLWFAYRVALLVAANLPITEPLHGEAPCSRCAEKPCLAVCPAGALSADNSPDIIRCLDWRQQPESSCEMRCLSRLACPNARESRYSEDQIRYHYLHSLRSWRRRQKLVAD